MIVKLERACLSFRLLVIVVVFVVVVVVIVVVVVVSHVENKPGITTDPEAPPHRTTQAQSHFFFKSFH